MKTFAWSKCRDIYFEAIFSHSRKRFSRFPHTIFVIILRDMIGLENFLLSFSQAKSTITMCHFAPVLHFVHLVHLNCTPLSQSESSNIFMYIINNISGAPSRGCSITIIQSITEFCSWISTQLARQLCAV